MNDLVEKVARAICRKSWNEDYLQADMRLEDIVDGSWGEYVEESRAAIAAVAEWLEEGVGTPSAYVTADNLREQLEQPK